MAKKRRPQGTCQLCSKLVWAGGVRFDNGIRHDECQPGKGGHRYGVAAKERKR